MNPWKTAALPARSVAPVRNVSPLADQVIAADLGPVPQSETQVLPFKLTGGGPAPDGLPLFPGGTGPHTSTGTATHLGKHTGSGTFELGSLNISATGAVSGTFQGT